MDSLEADKEVNLRLHASTELRAVRTVNLFYLKTEHFHIQYWFDRHRSNVGFETFALGNSSLTLVHQVSSSSKKIVGGFFCDQIYIWLESFKLFFKVLSFPWGLGIQFYVNKPRLAIV